MKLLVKLLVTAVALLITAYLVPGFEVASITAAIVAALVLGLVNMVIKPIMLLVTLPFNIMTLGLFTFVINALMLGLAAWVVPGFDILGILPALAGAVVLSFVSLVLSSLIKEV